MWSNLRPRLHGAIITAHKWSDIWKSPHLHVHTHIRAASVIAEISLSILWLNPRLLLQRRWDLGAVTRPAINTIRTHRTTTEKSWEYGYEPNQEEQRKGTKPRTTADSESNWKHKFRISKRTFKDTNILNIQIRTTDQIIFIFLEPKYIHLIVHMITIIATRAQSSRMDNRKSAILHLCTYQRD